MNEVEEKIYNKFCKDNSKIYKTFRWYKFNNHISIFASKYIDMEGIEVAQILSNGTIIKCN